MECRTGETEVKEQMAVSEAEMEASFYQKFAISAEHTFIMTADLSQTPDFVFWVYTPFPSARFSSVLFLQGVRLACLAERAGLEG